jgi:hypothetical protein
MLLTALLSKQVQLAELREAHTAGTLTPDEERTAFSRLCESLDVVLDELGEAFDRVSVSSESETRFLAHRIREAVGNVNLRCR